MKDNKFISFGGNGEFSHNTTELMFEPFHRVTTTYQFKQLTDKFPARYGFSVVEYNNRLYVFGGKNVTDTGDGSITNEFFCYDLGFLFIFIVLF
jgi:hypothetical protein